MAWAPAAIQAGGQLAGAAVGGKGAKAAAQIQARSNAEALAFTREQDAKGRADWDKAMQAWEANRNALLQRLGVDIPQAAYRAPAAPVKNYGDQPTWQGGPPGDPDSDNLAALIGRGGYTGQPNRYGLR